MNAHAIPHASWQQPALHPVYVRVLGAVLARHGIDPPALLAPAQLSLALIDDDHAMIAFAPLHALISAALERSACPWLGLEVGAAAHIHTHGSVGHATIASGTLDTALHTLARFAALRTRAVRFEIERAPGETVLRIVPAFDLGAAAGFLIDALVVIVERMLQTLSGTRLDRARYELPRPRPDWAARYGEYLAGTVDFVAGSVAALHFDQRILARPCLTADAQAFARATVECEGDLERSTRAPALSTRVQRLLSACSDHYPSAADIARQLHLAPRSLFRQLRAEGSSYRELLDRERRERACWLLTQTRLPVERIAERLGYADTSNFSRVFRRMLGVTPREYRQRQPAHTP